MANFENFVLLLLDWFLLIVILALTVKSIFKIMPYAKETSVLKTLWYLFVAFGYSLICVTLFTSYVIWFMDIALGVMVFMLTWFIFIAIFTIYNQVMNLKIEDDLKMIKRKKIRF